MCKIKKLVYTVDLTCMTLPYDTHLVEQLIRQGVDVDLWVAGCDPRQDKDLPSQSLVDVAGNISSPLFRKILKGGEYLINTLFLHWRMRSKSPEVVHYQWLPFAGKVPIVEILNLKRAKKSGASVVYTVHNVLPHDTGDRLRHTFERIYQIPDALICHTEKSKSDLVNKFDIDPDRIWVIPHGPLSGEVSPIPLKDARRCLGVDTEKQVCLLFGFLRPYKGIEFLLDSWSRVKDKHPSFQLMIVGKPKQGYEKYIKSRIDELGLDGEIVTKFKFVDEEELNTYIHAANVLVYPYRSITQSGALLTGLTTGKPVVATNVGGFSEVIEHGETGCLVKYGDEEQLAEVLVRLLRDADKRQELGEAGKEMVKKEYSWDVIAQKTLRCYQEVINES